MDRKFTSKGITLGERVCDLLGLDPARINRIAIEITAYPETVEIVVNLRDDSIQYLDLSDIKFEEVE